MSCIIADLESLPRGALTMSLLIRLPSPRLRRLLKAGLRRGLSHAELAEVLKRDWGLELDSPDANGLLAALSDRGWLTEQLPQQIWKTHLGNAMDG